MPSMILSKSIPTPADVMRSLKKEKNGGIDVLFAEYYYLLTLFADRMVRNQLLAEEFAAAALIRLGRPGKKIKDHSSVKAWLFRTVRQLSLDHLSRVRSRFTQAGPEATGDSIREALIYAETLDLLIKSSKKVPR
jgi:DNA-directed RNA polymerase specialized sigma24 family protein